MDELKSYNRHAFHSNLLTKETIDGLRDVHKKLMGVSRPGMEIYGILVQDFWPLIQSNSELHDEFIMRLEFEQEADAFLPEDVILKVESFKCVSALLKDAEYRISNLMERDEFFRSQQFISDVCLEMISFANSIMKNRADFEKKKRGRGRPKQTKFERGYIIAGDARVRIRGNVPVTRLCKKLFELPLGQTIHWVDLYQHIYEVHDVADEKGWRKIRLIIGRVNENMKQHGKGDIFEFEGVESGKVLRLY